ncbi:GTPase IMAP family member 7-like [Epinephelus lanceolatus]
MPLLRTVAWRSKKHQLRGKRKQCALFIVELKNEINIQCIDGHYSLSVSDTRRVVILGKTGAGKSSLANTIFGEKPFKVDDSANSGTTACQAETKSVNGRNITLIDTPGFFVTEKSEEELNHEILRCITECAPGPHAFLIVLKVEKFTKQEQAVINKIHQYFSEEVFKYATVVFTCGDQLKGQTIEEFVRQNTSLSDLVKKCGGRCHVIDNEYWKNNQQDEYRSNKYQVKELLKTIDELTEANKGRCYTNEMLQVVQEIIEQKKMHIRKSSGNMSEEEITRQAKDRAFKEIWIRLAGVATGVLLGALFGVVAMVLVVVSALKELVPAAKTVIAGGAAGAGGLGATGITFISAAAVGAAVGGYKGYHAAEGADTPWEAAKMTAAALKEGAQSIISTIDGVRDRLNVSSKPTYSKLKESEEL